jgi:hypothetical protein
MLVQVVSAVRHGASSKVLLVIITLYGPVVCLATFSALADFVASGKRV